MNNIHPAKYDSLLQMFWRFGVWSILHDKSITKGCIYCVCIIQLFLSSFLHAKVFIPTHIWQCAFFLLCKSPPQCSLQSTSCYTYQTIFMIIKFPKFIVKECEKGEEDTVLTSSRWNCHKITVSSKPNAGFHDT